MTNEVRPLKVENMTRPTTPCREWQGSRNYDGYGVRPSPEYDTDRVHRQIVVKSAKPSEIARAVAYLRQKRSGPRGTDVVLDVDPVGMM